MLDHTDLPHAMDLMYCGGDDAMHTMYQRHTVVTWFIVIRDVLFIIALIRPFRPEHRPPNPVSLCWLCAGSSFLIILLLALSALGIGLQILDPVSLRWLSYCDGSSFRILLPYSPHSPYAPASNSWTRCLCASSVLARRFFLFVFSPYVVFSPHPSVAFELSQISRE